MASIESTRTVDEFRTVFSDVTSGIFNQDIKNGVKWAKSFTTEEEIEEAKRILLEIKNLVSQLNEFSRPVLSAILTKTDTSNVSDLATASMISLLVSNKTGLSLINIFKQFKSGGNKISDQQLDLELEEEFRDIQGVQEVVELMEVHELITNQLSD